MYAITCCSTADLPAQFYEKTGISYAKFHFSMNGVEYDDDLGLSISPEEFYQQICDAGLEERADLYLLKHAGHGTPEFFQPETKKIVVEFFDRYLKSKTPQ